MGPISLLRCFYCLARLLSRGLWPCHPTRRRSAERTNSLIAARLPGQLASVDATVRSLARQSSSLASDLSGLESYLAQGGSSADPAFLKLQIQYLISASSRVQANAALLERRLGATVDTASSLSNPQ